MRIYGRFVCNRVFVLPFVRPVVPRNTLVVVRAQVHVEREFVCGAERRGFGRFAQPYGLSVVVDMQMAPDVVVLVDRCRFAQFERLRRMRAD